MTGMTWHNEPVAWSLNAGTLTVECAADTDFWRKTHYGFVHANGHFYYREISGDFRVEVKAEGQYLNQYDQAGLMLWLDERNWLKAGVEFLDGRRVLSVVVTHEFSDWSVDSAEAAEVVTVRVTREGDAVTVEFIDADGTPKMARLAYMGPEIPARVGPMACAPSGAGFIATFSGWRLGFGEASQNG
jgi:uncharacterized protein